MTTRRRTNGGRRRWAQRLSLCAAAALGAVAVTAIALTAEDAGAGDDASDPADLPRDRGRHPVISEVVTSNASSLADADGDHSDWIELRNPHDEPQDLAGYHLSDDDEDPARWSLPDITLAPDEHVVVFASGKDRDDPDGELHTDFRLGQADEPVLLAAPDGVTVADRVARAEVPRDASFGRDPEDPDRRCYFALPTPGEPNAPECFDDAELGAPELSAASGFYDEPFDLEITAGDPDATIIYTLDGSYPDPDANPEQTLEYDGPIAVEDRTGPPELATIDATASEDSTDRLMALAGAPDLDDEEIEQGTVVRARTTHGAESAATFFVGEDKVREDLPVISLAMDPDYLFDHDDGIYVAGRTFEEYRDSDAFDPAAGWNIPTNYNQRGRDWERPHADDLRRAVILEHCRPGGDCAHQRQVGVRTHGGFSRRLPQKSLRLYARNDYGDRRFDEPLLGADGPSGHRRLLLRNSGNDNRRLMLVDGYLQSLMGDLSADTQAHEPTAVFVNGEYWGIHNLRERYDRHYLEVAHGADPDRAQLLRNSDADDMPPAAVASWRRLLERLGGIDPGADRFADEAETALDVDSLYDFLIAQLFVGNSDWGHGNVSWWREPADPHQLGEAGPDGRWRWLIADLDHQGGGAGRHDAGFDALADRLPPTDDPERFDGFPFLFTRMMENEDLRQRFLNRFADHLNTTFEPTRTTAHLDEVSGRVADEMERHTARWQTAPPEKWERRLGKLADFMRERPAAQREQLADRFGLGGSAHLRVTHDPDAGSVRVSSLDLTAQTPGIEDPADWEGHYFQGVPVTVEAVPRDGYRFVGWKGAPSDRANQRVVDVELDGDATLEPVFVRD